MQKTYPVVLVSLAIWKANNITFRLGVMNPFYRRIVPVTDRSVRDGEIEGYEYQFVSSMPYEGLAAHMTHDGTPYGILSRDVDVALENGNFPIMACDADALEALRALWPDTLAILIDMDGDGAEEVRSHDFDIVFDDVSEGAIANTIDMLLTCGGHKALDNPRKELKTRLCETLCGIPLTRTMDEVRHLPYECSTDEMYDLETSLGIDARAKHLRDALAPSPVWGLNAALVSHDGDMWVTLVVSGGAIISKDRFRTQGCALAALTSPSDARELHTIENSATEASATTRSRMLALAHMDVLLNTTFSAVCEELDLACVNAPKEGLTRISASCGEPHAILKDPDDIRAVIATIAFTYDLWDMDADTRTLLATKDRRAAHPHPIEVTPAHMVDASLIESVSQERESEAVPSEDDVVEGEGETIGEGPVVDVMVGTDGEPDDMMEPTEDGSSEVVSSPMTNKELQETWGALLDDLRSENIPGGINEIYQSVPVSDDGEVVTIAVMSKQKLITMLFHNDLWSLFRSHFENRDVNFVPLT